uniref:Protein kinase domain-containing protein n=2 Tax=Heterosigma akashiwo TaxID=2829 RepID=A0A7S3XZF5_HETAK
MGNKSSGMGADRDSKRSGKVKNHEGQERTFASCYQLGDELGTGAYSKVKKCTDKSNGKEWAAKIVNRAQLQPEDAQALEDEIKIMKELDHEHVIKLADVFNEGAQTILVLELVVGGELFDRIVQKEKYTEKEARDLVALLLRTLDYLHTHDIVHRDLKPENLLLTSREDDANIKIADFGFARHISEVREMEEACGTPGYVAPEILRGLKYSGKADLWSAGVITYILLGGYPPFYDEDQDQLFRKIRRGQYQFHAPYWDHVSEEARDLISQMLVVNHKQRQSAAELLRHPWIVAADADLAGKDLAPTLTEFRKFNARRKLRAAMETVIALNRFRRFSTVEYQKSKSLDDDQAESSQKGKSALESNEDGDIAAVTSIREQGQAALQEG